MVVPYRTLDPAFPIPTGWQEKVDGHVAGYQIIILTCLPYSHGMSITTFFFVPVTCFSLALCSLLASY